jgi:hypothetical protein
MRFACTIWLWTTAGRQARTSRASRAKPRGSGIPRLIFSDSVGMPSLPASSPIGPSGVRDTMRTW